MHPSKALFSLDPDNLLHTPLFATAISIVVFFVLCSLSQYCETWQTLHDDPANTCTILTYLKLIRLGLFKKKLAFVLCSLTLYIFVVQLGGSCVNNY